MTFSERPLILFDGGCRLCNSSVNFIKKRDKKKFFDFIPLQSAEALKINNLPILDNKAPASIILIENGKTHQLSEAVLLIAYHLVFPWNLLFGFIIIPSFIRDYVYMVISRNRYKWFGKSRSCNIA
jgi:predicted DCC family thiol-disulfide oxidoreductase YuxK